MPCRADALPTLYRLPPFARLICPPHHTHALDLACAPHRCVLELFTFVRSGGDPEAITLKPLSEEQKRNLESTSNELKTELSTNRRWSSATMPPMPAPR